MNKNSKINLIKKYVMIFFTAVCMAMAVTGCGDKTEESDTTQTAAKSGEVGSAEELTQVGVYLDVSSDDKNITNVKYEISGDIAIVSFRYNGIKVELRGSYKYKEYELAGIDNTSNGDMIVTNVHSCPATFYTLNPGRIAFWNDDKINYSLYIYVTATDDVLADVLSDIKFENRYDDRADVKDRIENDSVQFAKDIIKVFNDRDVDKLKDMILYPQETGGGQSLSNENEVLNVNKDELFTDILINALNNEESLKKLRKSEDGSEYIIGTNYKNVHFKLTDDGNFIITKINN